MQIKIKKQKEDRTIRMEALSRIAEVIINEDISRPYEETVSICFKGEDCSGILEMSPEEIEHIHNIIKKKAHLIKGYKAFVEKDAPI